MIHSDGRAGGRATPAPAPATPGGLAALVDRFAGVEVVVAGDALVDEFLTGSVTRLCREGPVPVAEVAQRHRCAGGAANAAANLAALGARVALVCAVGDDDPGSWLRTHLESLGVDVSGVRVVPGRQTTTKSRLRVDGTLLARWDCTPGAPMPAAEAAALRRRAEMLGLRRQSVLLSDYGYGVLDVLPTGLGRLAAAGGVLVVDGRRPERFAPLAPTAVKPNAAEAGQLLGAPEAFSTGDAAGRAAVVASAADRLLERLNARMVAVTLDRAGAVLVDVAAPPYRTYARPVPDRAAAGAGDTYAAVLTLALRVGAAPHEAAELAGAAAALVTSTDEVSACTAEQLRAAVSHGRERVLTLDAACGTAERLRASGRRVVLANGCFDVLHRGHVALLDAARGLGDALFVGVNDDGSVRRVKGPHRPVVGLEDRLAVLSALSGVDYLVPYGGDTASDLVRAVRPHLLVKGDDHDRRALPESAAVAEVGGEVVIVPRTSPYSGGDLIRRIRGEAS